MCFSLISEKLTNKALDIQSVFHLLSLWWTLKLIRFSFSSGKATCDGRWGAVEADWMEWWWMYCGGMIDLKKKSQKAGQKIRAVSQLLMIITACLLPQDYHKPGQDRWRWRVTVSPDEDFWSKILRLHGRKFKSPSTQNGVFLWRTACLPHHHQV